MELKEAEAAAAAEAATLDALNRQYAEVRGGLEHLGAMVAGLPLAAGAMPGPPPSVSDETLGDVVAQVRDCDGGAIAQGCMAAGAPVARAAGHPACCTAGHSGLETMYDDGRI